MARVKPIAHLLIAALSCLIAESLAGCARSAPSSAVLPSTTSIAQPADKSRSTSRLRTLYSFAGGASGKNPYGGLVFDRTGRKLYGTTQYGGKNRFGTIFELDLNTERKKTLYSFTAGLDGAYPQAALIMDAKGALYGTSISVPTQGGGAVFKLDPATRNFTVLHAFRGGADGFFPMAPLVFDKAGMLYGTTQSGGGAGYPACPLFCGTVFRLDPKSRVTTILHAFTQGTDGGEPFAGLTFGPDGLLYGTTFDGGSSSCGASGSGCGVVFRIDPSSGAFTTLHAFASGANDGAFPLGAVVFSSSGLMYSTTEGGGAHLAGTIFSLDLGSQTFTLLHTFSLLDDNGGFPNAGLTFDPSGTVLYGTAFFGGNKGCRPAGGAGCGTVFSYAPASQAYSSLYRFTGKGDGGNPSAGIILDHGGALYGVTAFGGIQNAGTAFQYTP
jgi:uncharacterized repeat protein (TIGR03803 family)